MLVSECLRQVAAPFVAALPGGARVRARLRVSPDHAAVLRARTWSRWRAVTWRRAGMRSPPRQTPGRSATTSPVTRNETAGTSTPRRGPRRSGGGAGDRATRTRPPGQAPHGTEPHGPGGGGTASTRAAQDNPAPQVRTQEARCSTRLPAAIRRQDRQASPTTAGYQAARDHSGPSASRDYGLLAQQEQGNPTTPPFRLYG